MGGGASIDLNERRHLDLVARTAVILRELERHSNRADARLRSRASGSAAASASQQVYYCYKCSRDFQAPDGSQSDSVICPRCNDSFVVLRENPPRSDENEDDEGRNRNIEALLHQIQLMQQTLILHDSRLQIAYNSAIQERQQQEAGAPEHLVDALETVKLTAEQIETCGSCSICLDPWTVEEEGSLAVRLPCSHLFHSDCIKQWLSVRNSCPMCRTPLAETDNGKRAGGDEAAETARENESTATGRDEGRDNNMGESALVSAEDSRRTLARIGGRGGGGGGGGGAGESMIVSLSHQHGGRRETGMRPRREEAEGGVRQGGIVGAATVAVGATTSGGAAAAAAAATTTQENVANEDITAVAGDAGAGGTAEDYTFDEDFRRQVALARAELAAEGTTYIPMTMEEGTADTIADELQSRAAPSIDFLASESDAEDSEASDEGIGPGNAPIQGVV